MAFQRDYYGDPMQAAMRKQAQSCHRCMFEQVVRFGTDQVKICAKDRQYGVKCKLFTEKGAK